ncbi:DUF2971 domain-containing protein [Bradyrhizobium lablabi]|uniref:DUF2971 domain-containing protein n=1 Tax=Bradyrhizobium lablabi TaxID=722472 RepID=UPI001BA6F49A|nr:DUF2971 domain-containing protein [Bradyrhizobium lablabi]MBR1121089.1 DUF2971 domain-containing protein [Bradyrhizobium lablabi]
MTDPKAPPANPSQLDDAGVLALYNPLFEPFLKAHAGGSETPLLAHYTSIKVMESVLKTSEIWFFNPLLMNDWQEMRHGAVVGTELFSNIDNIKRAGGNDERAEILRREYLGLVHHLEEHQAFDTYIFCLTEHLPADNDGLLSMWRGYGQQGNGAALVFDPSRITVVPDSPIVVAKVSYATEVARSDKVRELLEQWAELTQSLNLPNDQLHLAAYAAFWIIKSLALVTKHYGFAEEKEWRLIYEPDRDDKGLLKPNLNYHIGARGVEPALKYKIGYLPGVSAEDFSLEKILDRIILGPSHSSPLAQKSVERLLDTIGKAHLKPLLRASSIPLRRVSGSSF